ncbi:MAG: redoxin family protein [Pirellulales bacterium]|nr:redoxin family protein [Pirellulales bacterium]
MVLTSFTRGLVLITAAGIFSVPAAMAQDENKSDSPVAAEEQAKAVDTTKAFTKLVNAGELDEAAKLLDDAIAAKPEDQSLRRLQQLLAIRYASKRDYANAYTHLKQLFDYRAENTETAAHVQELVQYARQLYSFGSRSGHSEEATAAINKAVKICRAAAKKTPSKLLLPLTELLNQQVSILASSDQGEEAQKIGREHLNLLNEFNSSDQANDQTIQAQARLLFSLSRVSDKPEKEKLEAQLDEFIDAAFEQRRESKEIQNEYANVKYMRVATSYRDDPEAAQQRIEELREVLQPLAEDNRMVKNILDRTSSIESRIESALKLQRMVGSPAPPLDVDAWVNASDVSEDSLKGKVVLYDFWAIWCGPCIATFPHLRDWRAEFKDEGFEVVGITRYYNYKWDEETEKAGRSQEDVSPEDEQLAIEKFLQSHDLSHPSIITPKESELQTQYAVTGIPHAVLVDREGKIQMIKVGSSPQNAADLHAKIKELVAQ